MTRDREELAEVIRDAMALCARVRAGLASGKGYQPPGDAEEGDRSGQG